MANYKDVYKNPGCFFVKLSGDIVEWVWKYIVVFKQVLFSFFVRGWCFGGGGVLSRTFIDMFLILS